MFRCLFNIMKHSHDHENFYNWLFLGGRGGGGGGERKKENYFQKVFSVELCIEYFGKVCHGYIVVWLFSHNRLPLRNIFDINLVNFRKIPWQFASVCPWPTKSYMKILWKPDSQSELWIDANFKLDFSVKIFSP